jgi:hypothetical protein
MDNALDTNTLSELRATLKGRVITPSDEAYKQARTVSTAASTDDLRVALPACRSGDTSSPESPDLPVGRSASGAGR